MQLRREICAGLAAFTLLVAFASADVGSSSNGTRVQAPIGSTHVQSGIRSGLVKSRGVNLGGWLVAENWMTADAAFWNGVDDRFANSGEYTAITKAASPDSIRSKLKDHHANFISEDDIEQIAAAGLNTKQSPDEMVGFMEAPQFTNVWVEWHPYFIWGYEHTSDEQLVSVAVKQQYRARVDKWNARAGHNRLFLGEWSVATASNMRRNKPDLFYSFAQEQLQVHEQAEGGWTLWTWKAAGNNVDDWSLQKLLTDDRLRDMLRSDL
ncbi:hypothetical protein KRP22_012236 [Phytophthora ramorum]|nr:putative glucan 1,3-beta-glucosidase A [Phytophthora ramorum]